MCLEVFPDGVSIAWVDGHLLTSDVRLIVLPKQAGENPWASTRFIEVTVEDTGVGLREEDMKRILDPFEQAASPLTRRFEGTDLWLALTKEFMELHGGRIWAESQGPGKGLSSRFAIPVSQPRGVYTDAEKG